METPMIKRKNLVFLNCKTYEINKYIYLLFTRGSNYISYLVGYAYL